jgi:toxin ParE1/3/4
VAKLSFSPLASRDLEEIGDYIARDNPERALSFLAELEAHCRRIVAMPTAFPFRDDIALGVQMAVHGKYLILFHVEGERIRIERIIHGARQLLDLI